MPHSHSLYKYHRRQNHLLLSDLAFLLNTSDLSALSRCEKGKRCPNLPILLLYHLLFDLDLTQLLEQQIAEMKQTLQVRVADLVAMIEEAGPSPRTEVRTAFLKNLLTRLS